MYPVEQSTCVRKKKYRIPTSKVVRVHVLYLRKVNTMDQYISKVTNDKSMVFYEYRLSLFVCRSDTPKSTNLDSNGFGILKTHYCQIGRYKKL